MKALHKLPGDYALGNFLCGIYVNSLPQRCSLILHIPWGPLKQQHSSWTVQYLLCVSMLHELHLRKFHPELQLSVWNIITNINNNELVDCNEILQYSRKSGAQLCNPAEVHIIWSYHWRSHWFCSSSQKSLIRCSFSHQMLKGDISTDVFLQGEWEWSVLAV